MFKKFLSMILFALSIDSAVAVLPVQLEKICNQALNYSESTGDILSVNPPAFAENYLVYKKYDENLFLVENYLGKVVFDSSEKLNAMTEVNNGIWIASLYDLMKINFKGIGITATGHCLQLIDGAAHH